jgi:hypothetical protein
VKTNKVDRTGTGPNSPSANSGPLDKFRAFQQTKCSHSQAMAHEAKNTTATAAKLWLLVFVFLVIVGSSSPLFSATAGTKPPDLNLIVQRVEGVEHQNPARSRPHEVTREYKVFHGDDKQPTSELMVQIDFVPPDTKTYKITQVRGESRGEKMVRELLDQETEMAAKPSESQISRTNYDFVFLRQDNFGVGDEYVLGIVPKRKEKYLFRGQIWVDASTFRIRRMEGVPAKSPSFWIKNIHITVQFADLSGMWVPISFDAIASVRFSGHYTIAGLNMQSSPSATKGAS